MTKIFRLPDYKLKELIAEIDHFHGNELKDRSTESVQKEMEAIREWLNGLTF